MCGIAGFLVPESSISADAAQAFSARARRMAQGIAHRGPDDEGVWTDTLRGVALAHRRLSILDLSPEGHQPMVSHSGRYIISFNGEIYNYQTLRARLNHQWRGGSDTEVLLAAIESWGIEKTLAELSGMFAFALWDRQEQCLTLARDPLGEKPLYYGWVNGEFVFASELSAICAGLAQSLAINRRALALLMRYSYIPAPYSMLEGIYKLPPASFITLRAGEEDALPKSYWSVAEVALAARSTPPHFSEAEAIDHFESHLKLVIRQQMVADVPLGAFLSGGVDSSTVVALMQAQSARPIQTFTIGFHEYGFNEAPHAQAVARHLGTEHHEFYVSAMDTLNVIPKLSGIYSEPFADASQLPTFLVSQFARKHVTVALSGDGGDELLGGYNRHVKGPKLWQMASHLPPGLRKTAVQAYLALQARVPNLPHIHALEALAAPTREAFYQALCATHLQPELVLEHSQLGAPFPPPDPRLSFAEWMMLSDTTTYFPGDIMAKLDRASMAVGLETRTPFTDPALIALVWQLPLTMKIRGSQGKWILRQLLNRYVPPALTERPKAGFAVPICQWLRGPLHDWAADLLNPSTLRQQGFLNADTIALLWQQHQSGTRDRSKALWNVLMFQQWLQRYTNA